MAGHFDLFWMPKVSPYIQLLCTLEYQYAAGDVDFDVLLLQ